MRKSASLDPLLPKTTLEVLAVTLVQPERWSYLSELANRMGRSPSSVQGPLASLVKCGVLRRRKDGNRVYFQPDPQCPFLPELRGLITKTVGVVDVLRRVLGTSTERIDLAFVYGSVARGEERSSSDIDLLVVGTAGLSDLASSLREAENQFNRPINTTVYSRAEFRAKLDAGNHFLRAVLDNEKIFVIGNEHDLERTAGRQSRRAAPDKQARNRRPAKRRTA